MSKWSTFAKIAMAVGPMALKFTPLAPIAEAVSAGIAEAQQIPGASGTEKLDHVTKIALAAADAANAQEGRIVLDPLVVKATAADAIATAHGAIKLVHDAHEKVPAA